MSIRAHVSTCSADKIFLRVLTFWVILFIIPADSCSFAAVNVRLPLSLEWNDKPVSAARRLESAGFSKIDENNYKGNFMDHEVSVTVSFKGRNGILQSVRIYFYSKEIFAEMSDMLTRELGEPTREYLIGLEKLHTTQSVLNSPYWYFRDEGILVYLSNYFGLYGYVSLVYINIEASKEPVWPMVMKIIIFCICIPMTMLHKLRRSRFWRMKK